MYDDVTTNLALIEEKLNSSCPKDLNDLKNLFTITEHLLKLEHDNQIIEKYNELKETYIIKSNNIDENINTQYHLYDHAYAINMQRYNKMLEISDKVDEVNELNDFLASVVHHQGSQIDNILAQINLEEERTENIVYEMKKTHKKYRRRNKIIKFLMMVVMFFVVAYILKIVFSALINKLFK